MPTTRFDVRIPSALRALRRRVAARAARGDGGASTIETVIIAASLAALALATMATITLLVNGKVAGIHL